MAPVEGPNMAWSDMYEDESVSSRGAKQDRERERGGITSVRDSLSRLGKQTKEKKQQKEPSESTFSSSHRSLLFRSVISGQRSTVSPWPTENSVVTPIPHFPTVLRKQKGNYSNFRDDSGVPSVPSEITERRDSSHRKSPTPGSRLEWRGRSGKSTLKTTETDNGNMENGDVQKMTNEENDKKENSFSGSGKNGGSKEGREWSQWRKRETETEKEREREKGREREKENEREKEGEREKERENDFLKLEMRFTRASTLGREHVRSRGTQWVSRIIASRAEIILNGYKRGTTKGDFFGSKKSGASSGSGGRYGGGKESKKGEKEVKAPEAKKQGNFPPDCTDGTDSTYGREEGKRGVKLPTWKSGFDEGGDSQREGEEGECKRERECKREKEEDEGEREEEESIYSEFPEKMSKNETRAEKREGTMAIGLSGTEEEGTSAEDDKITGEADTQNMDEQILFTDDFPYDKRQGDGTDISTAMTVPRQLGARPPLVCSSPEAAGSRLPPLPAGKSGRLNSVNEAERRKRWDSSSGSPLRMENDYFSLNAKSVKSVDMKENMKQCEDSGDCSPQVVTCHKCDAVLLVFLTAVKEQCEGNCRLLCRQCSAVTQLRLRRAL